MSQHKASIEWKNELPDLGYETYSRDHSWKFDNGLTIQATAAPEYKGNPKNIDPEEAFVSSLASCHMLTFLAICAKKRINVKSYKDNAIGYLESNENKKLAVTRVELHPKVIFSSENNISKEDLEKIHHSAHGACFIANSVKTKVDIIID